MKLKKNLKAPNFKLASTGKSTFELNKIYEKEICISPIKSISLHMTNVNSSYGLSPFIDYKSLWDENNYQ